MVELVNLSESRNDLIDLLKEVHPSSKKDSDAKIGLELYVYDLFLNVTCDYQANKSDLWKAYDEKRTEPHKERDITWEAEVKSRRTELEKHLSHSPGYIIAMNFDITNQRHEAHISKDGNFSLSCVGKYFTDEASKDDLIGLQREDGAICVDPNGIVYATNIIFKKLDWDKLPSVYDGSCPELSVQPEGPPYTRHGYIKPVRTRNLNTLGTTSQLRSVVGWAHSEEHQIARRYFHGFLTFSSDPQENKIAQKIVEHHLWKHRQRV